MAMTTERRDRHRQVPTPDPGNSSIAGDLAGLLWDAIKGILGLAALLVGLLARATARFSVITFAFVRLTTVGRLRDVAAPIWILALALASSALVADTASWYWLIVAITVEASVWTKAKPKRLSIRERRVLACALASCALAMDLRAYAQAPFQTFAAAASIGVLVQAVRWWKWRLARAAKRAAILGRWETEVVGVDERFAGKWIEFDDETGAGIYESSALQASELARLDERAEWLLHQPAGTVTIATDPRISRRWVRIAFSEPGDALRMRFRDGSTLERNGQFVCLHANGSVSMFGRFWQTNGRACHIGAVAPTTAGKGGFMRHLVLEAAGSPIIGLIGVDGKKGAGFGYMRAGFLTLATRKEDWKPAVDRFMAALDERSERFGEADADSFIATADDPYLFLVLGELPQLLAAHPSIGAAVKKITEIGGSLGMGVWAEMQKGDGPSWGSTGARGNVLDGGWLWAGPATDAQSKIVMTQGIEFDPMTLPPEPGWAAVMGRVLGDQPVVPGRQLWTPNRRDVTKAVTELGMTEAEAAPFGTVEERLALEVVQPTMHPATARALGLVDEPASVELTAEAPPVEAIITIEPPRFIPAEPSNSVEAAELDGWSRIVGILKAAGPSGLLRGQIAKRAGLSDTHTSNLIRAHAGEVVQESSKAWRLAS